MGYAKKVVEAPIEPLKAIIVGASGSGKSTALASLLREPTLLIYSKQAESHSLGNLLKGLELFEGASQDNLFAVAYDYDEEKDVPLSGDASIKKLEEVIEEASSLGVKYVAFDSFTALSNAINQTKKYQNETKGGVDGFACTRVARFYYELVVNKLLSLSDSHKINVVCVVGAKISAFDSLSYDTVAIEPELPYYSIAKELMFRFQTILPIVSRENQFGHRSIFDFGVKVSKASVNRDTKQVVKFTGFQPRLASIPISVQLKISELPVDIHYAKEFAIQLAQQEQPQ